MISFDAALTDKNLLGAALGGDLQSWATWRAVTKAAYGEKLDKRERRLFAAVAGERDAPRERVSELWAIVGRRGGKSRMAGALSVYEAAFVDHSAHLSPGETGFVLCLSPSVAQASLVKNYAHAFLDASPILKQKIENVTQTEIRLKGNITIATHPNSFRTTRGRTLLACVADEMAFWRSEDSASPDTEVYTALLPSLATSNGLLIGISSPYAKRGLLYQKHRENFGQSGDVLIVQGGSTVFNPTLSQKIIARAKAADPEGSGAEWDGEFRNDLSSLIDDAMLEAAIDSARPLELPRAGKNYCCFVDASGGKHDAFTACIGHSEGDVDAPRFVCDVIRGVKAPFDPATVAADHAALAKSYGCSGVTGDAFAGEWVAQAFERHGLKYEQSDLPKSQLYLEALPLFASARVKIPDHPQLIRELRLLERRTHRSGRDTVDHPANGSDDFANALCGAMRFATRGGYDTSLSWV